MRDVEAQHQQWVSPSASRKSELPPHLRGWLPKLHRSGETHSQTLRLGCLPPVSGRSFIEAGGGGKDPQPDA